MPSVPLCRARCDAPSAPSSGRWSNGEAWPVAPVCGDKLPAEQESRPKAGSTNFLDILVLIDTRAAQGKRSSPKSGREAQGRERSGRPKARRTQKGLRPCGGLSGSKKQKCTEVQSIRLVE
ncbi:MAG: hypothetical protein [Arizlama microvirus]|nr:MAG: hypothetical protein [Arizlama microvirus]